MTPSPTQSNVFAALKAFLTSILPDGVVVRQAQLNRVSEPKAGDFVLMTPMRQDRIETNVDAFADLAFTGSIATTTMTVTAIDARFDAPIEPGLTVFGTGVAAGTKVVAQLTGPTGGTGTYSVSVSQNLSSRTLSAGSQRVTQAVKQAIQLDFHSAAPGTAGDLAATFATLFRDAYAVESFAAQDPNRGVVPLYCEDPRQVPFTQDQQQWESRWVVEALLQCPVVVSVPQQFADAATVELISVEAAYPP